jgi:hypothetical protein
MSTPPIQKAERLERLARARGVNYLPSWARSPVEHWGPLLRPEILRRELGWVRALGLDHVRVWSSAPAWETGGETYVDGIGLLLDTAHDLELGVVVQLFDSCGTEPGGAGEQLTIEEVLARAEGDPRLELVLALGSEEGRDFTGQPAIETVVWRGDPMVVLWEAWEPSPGYDRLGPPYWPVWDAYAQAVLSRIADHPALLLVEVMNEPFLTQAGREVDRRPIVDFYRHATATVSAAAPSVPLAFGAQEPEDVVIHEADIGRALDVVGFHTYGGGAELRTKLDAAREVAAGRPLYVSEWGWFPGGPDEAQRAGLAERLPVLLEAEVGWAAFHLVAGYGPFALSSLLYPSGVMRPAATYLRDRLRVGA